MVVIVQLASSDIYVKGLKGKVGCVEPVGYVKIDKYQLSNSTYQENLTSSQAHNLTMQSKHGNDSFQ